LQVGSVLKNGVRTNSKEPAADILDLFVGFWGGSFLDRTFGEETTRGLAGTDVEKRANKGGGGANGIGDEGRGFTGASLVFLRRKPAMDTVGGGGQKRRWKYET
jgi:hypothetical protein